MTTVTKNDAPTLDALVDLLNAATLVRYDWERGGEIGPAVLRVDEIYDVTELPTYGGEMPGDIVGVFSWDTDRVLWADGPARQPWYAGGFE